MRRFVLAGLAIAASLWAAAGAAAHPMGNFSISHYAELRADAERLELRYVIDMAEIPTFQEIQEHGIVAETGHASLTGYLARKIEALGRGLRVESGGRPLDLQTIAREASVLAGAGGLPTLRLEARYQASLDREAAVHDVRYRDTNFPDRVGWKEIVAREGRGVTLVSSSAAASDRSRALTEYPTDLLNSPPQDLEARVVFARQTAQAPAPAPSSPTAPDAHASGPTFRAVRAGERAGAPPAVIVPDRAAPPRSGTPRSAFTELMTADRLSLGVVLVALAIAAGLGAFHALEPGHGKTLVAAYLVGSRGTFRHAALLGLVVTLTHTAAVYALGGVTLWASQYVVPDRLYPWLGLVSGLAVVGVGLSLLIRRGRHAAEHGHDHPQGHHHGHDHDHRHDHDHAHGHHHAHAHDAGGPPTLGTLLTLGVTGGIVPCPGALVVLLSAIALHRVGFGLLLIVAFSVGLAAVLIGLGLLMVGARRIMSRVRGDTPLVSRWLPLASSLVITLTGVGLTIQALATLGVRL
jgi:ABC-type nickel/cobalt efflux system permease component RcnA